MQITTNRDEERYGELIVEWTAEKPAGESY